MGQVMSLMEVPVLVSNCIKLHIHIHRGHRGPHECVGTDHSNRDIMKTPCAMTNNATSPRPITILLNLFLFAKER